VRVANSGHAARSPVADPAGHTCGPACSGCSTR
jgi:hypothetical protein